MLKLHSPAHLKLLEVSLSRSACSTHMYILRWETPVGILILICCNPLPYIYIPLLIRLVIAPSDAAAHVLSPPHHLLTRSD